MKQTRILMDMPVTVEVVGDNIPQSDLDAVFSYFESVDRKFSTFRDDSQVSLLNQGRLALGQLDPEVTEVLDLCSQTTEDTNGYFDLFLNGKIDPTGLVKGWAIKNAAAILRNRGYKNYFVSAGGDVQVSGKNSRHKYWSIGIKDPFVKGSLIKTVSLTTEGIATSGNYERGDHIVNPHHPGKKLSDLVSLTVIGPDIYEADRFATAAFAMGHGAFDFLNSRQDLAGFIIDRKGKIYQTANFNHYVV